MSHSSEHRTKNLVTRLNRIEGQVSGIKRMIIDEKDYAEVIIQLNSTKSAIQKISQILLEAQADHALIHVSEGATLKEEMEKLQRVITQYNKVN
ncbi:metal-sensitive transcriptional regulator (plasmid) [Jeotgalibaca sp. MA1X17-3]|uniref:metal-sensitive transcriptional regulator n=1 Tax=Jeotgalibaca sp. MA1X17-3 TaxID=2908211 RepID=UPI001F2277F7|nr:metal-sensitive transcriptional regulator [Jeotgalibaca sp. MA1X17-3]UJF16803.1 metal-sensitive transcriptional regulator [Jeotgalibaca sp. MA1X17-3]